MLDLEEGEPGPVRCPVCSGALILPDGLATIRWCKSCQTPHHLDCWQYNGAECAVYGCSPRRSPLVIEDDDWIPLEHLDYSPPLPWGIIVLGWVAMMAIMMMGWR